MMGHAESGLAKAMIWREAWDRLGMMVRNFLISADPPDISRYMTFNHKKKAPKKSKNDVKLQNEDIQYSTKLFLVLNG